MLPFHKVIWNREAKVDFISQIFPPKCHILPGDRGPGSRYVVLCLKSGMMFCFFWNILNVTKAKTDLSLPRFSSRRSVWVRDFTGYSSISWVPETFQQSQEIWSSLEVLSCSSTQSIRLLGLVANSCFGLLTYLLLQGGIGKPVPFDIFVETAEGKSFLIGSGLRGHEIENFCWRSL